MRRALVALLALAALAPRPSAAQERIAAGTLASPARLDSLGALRATDAAVREQPRDAAAWHRRGLLGWRLSGAERRVGFMKRVANDSLLELADSSLRLATRFAPDSAGYLVDLGRFYLTSNSAAVRGRSTSLFRRAEAAARASHDSTSLARALDELGMAAWRHYEDAANRHIYSYVLRNVKDRAFLKDPRSIAYFVDNEAIRAAAQEWSGQEPYLEAQQKFSDALRADPACAGALRHTYMLLADRKRWVELEHTSRVRLAHDSADGWAWLARGLAAHRLDDDAAATVAFAQALRWLPPAEAMYFRRVSPILTPKDSAEVARLPASERSNVREMYWLMADPLWASSVNEHRLEYLSRLVYAELRFSVEEFGIHGAGTDRGDVWVRYGPPPAIISFPPNSFTRHDSRVSVLWWYSTDEAFLFRELPTYRVATLASEDERVLNRLRDTIPVVWTNAGQPARTDSIVLQTARFRAAGDSADVFVAARIPVARLTEGIDLARGALHLAFDAYSWRAERVARDTLDEVLDFARANDDEVRSWRPRVAPGSYLYRVEALQPDAGRGARGAGRIEIPPATPFDMSDLLLAARVEPRGAAPERWSDFRVTPAFARLPRDSSVSLLWETYGLAPKDGDDEYTVNVTVSRVRGGGLGALVARIVGGVAGAVGLSRSGADSVSFTFPRKVSARPAVVDYITLDLGRPPAGRYAVSVAITDDVSGRRTARESAITIIE